MNLKPVVVVTGGSKYLLSVVSLCFLILQRGLGLAIVKILLQEFDAHVVALCRSPIPLSSEHLAWFECDMQVFKLHLHTD